MSAVARRLARTAVRAAAALLVLSLLLDLVDLATRTGAFQDLARGCLVAGVALGALTVGVAPQPTAWLLAELLFAAAAWLRPEQASPPVAVLALSLAGALALALSLAGAPALALERGPTDPNPEEAGADPHGRHIQPH